MSRVGKNPVTLPEGVDLRVEDDRIVVKGKLGELSSPVTDQVRTSLEEGRFWVKPANDSQRARALWGTTRAVVQNMVTGVSEGFTRRLEITGVGYRAQVQGKTLNLQLGYSHDVTYDIPEGVSVRCERPTSISVSGADKQQVGQVAAKIRGFRPPEPYKGKGIRYAGEQILRKEGKKK